MANVHTVLYQIKINRPKIHNTMFGSLTILFSHFEIIRQLIAPKKLLLWTTKFVLNLASEATNFSSFMKASVGALHGRVKKGEI